MGERVGAGVVASSRKIATARTRKNVVELGGSSDGGGGGGGGVTGDEVSGQRLGKRRLGGRRLGGRWLVGVGLVGHGGRWLAWGCMVARRPGGGVRCNGDTTSSYTHLWLTFLLFKGPWLSTTCSLARTSRLNKRFGPRPETQSPTVVGSWVAAQPTSQLCDVNGPVGPLSVRPLLDHVLCRRRLGLPFLLRGRRLGPHPPGKLFLCFFGVFFICVTLTLRIAL